MVVHNKHILVFKMEGNEREGGGVRRIRRMGGDRKEGRREERKGKEKERKTEGERSQGGI